MSAFALYASGFFFAGGCYGFLLSFGYGWREKYEASKKMEDMGLKWFAISALFMLVAK